MGKVKLNLYRVDAEDTRITEIKKDGVMNGTSDYSESILGHKVSFRKQKCASQK